MTPERWERIKTVFTEALRLDESGRQAYLESACGNDHSLRREVESLLAEEAKGTQFEPPAHEPELAGSAFSHFDIVEKIGEGGMGVVYRARDTKLDRDVAVKMLPPGLYRDASRMDRFRREARLLAQLNHPHIAAIYDFQESDGRHGLVMELVEGATLADKLKHGPLPVEEALSVAKQIAEALEAAHERGIIHRDLKPANIKLDNEGRVKVLDFGLAKAISGEPSETAPTVTAATDTGTVIGTAAYMSPEQARGERVDKRSDNWSFSAVLFEMLAGSRPFTGGTSSESLAAVLKEDPDWDALPAGVPRPIKELIRRCLRKDRRARLQWIGDARVTIEDVISGPAEPPSEILPDQRPKLRSLAAALVVAIVAAATGWLMYLLPEYERSPQERPIRRFLLAEGSEIGGAVVSPNGRYVCVGRPEGSWLYDLNTGESWDLGVQVGVGRQNPRLPFWSPDSQHLAYFTPGELMIISVTGGATTVVCELPKTEFLTHVSGSWSLDGETIVFHRGFGIHSKIYEVSAHARGGAASLLLEGNVGFPEYVDSSSGRHLLYFQSRGGHYGDIRILKANGESDAIVEHVPLFDFQYSHSGHILYRNDVYFEAEPDWYAVPFSLETLRPTGEPFLIRSRVHMANVSSDGSMVYVAMKGGDRRLVWKNRQGTTLEAVAQPGETLFFPVLSPDETRLAVAQPAKRGGVLWLYDLVRGGRIKATSPEKTGPARVWHPSDNHAIWSPDGRRIAFSASPDGQSWQAFMSSSDGDGEAIRLTDRPGYEDHPYDWSPEGRYIVLNSYLIGIGAFANYIDLESDGPPYKVRPFVKGAFKGRLSPDGRYLAYTLRNEVYIERFPEGGGRRLISVGGGRAPQWRGDGREIFYLDPKSSPGQFTMMSVKLTGSPPKPGKPQPLFRLPAFRLHAADFEVTADGQRFLIAELTKPESREVWYVENWLSEFRDQAQ